MPVDFITIAIDQLRRILESFGWKIIAQDTSGPMARVTIEKSKDDILKKG